MNPDPEKTDHEKERLQPQQENTAVATAAEPNAKGRKMESPKDAATTLAPETENGHWGNGHLPMVDAKAQKTDTIGSLPPTTATETKPGGQTEKPPLQEANTIPANEETKNEKRVNWTTITAVGGFIVAVLTFAYGVYKDGISQAQLPQFEIMNSQVTPDSVIIIRAANEAASRNGQLDIEFDGVILIGAGKIIPKSKPPRWAFRLKDNSPTVSQIDDGRHQMRFRFSGMPFSVPTDIIFVATDAPQFKIKNPDTHPDSAIIIVSQNEAAARRTPLNVKFDGQPFIEAGEIISASQPPQWSFRLKTQSPPAALIRNGTHWMQVGFPGMQYSDSVKITFAGEAFAENIVVEPPKPAETPVDTTTNKRSNSGVKPRPKTEPATPFVQRPAFRALDSPIVIVNLSSEASKGDWDIYTDRTQLILTTVNRNYLGKLNGFSGIREVLTDSGFAGLSKAFPKNSAYIYKSEIETKINFDRNYVEIGPIRLVFEQGDKTKSLYLRFNQENKPRLNAVKIE